MASVTKADVVAALDAEDYLEAAKLGAGALKHLKSIVEGDDWQLAAKAAYLAGLINEDASTAIVETAARSRKPAVRVAAAGAAAHLAPERAEPILTRLLKSKDVGVRKCAIRSVGASGTPKLCEKLDQIRKTDSEKGLRDLARDALTKSRQR